MELCGIWWVLEISVHQPKVKVPLGFNSLHFWVSVCSVPCKVEYTHALDWKETLCCCRLNHSKCVCTISLFCVTALYMAFSSFRKKYLSIFIAFTFNSLNNDWSKLTKHVLLYTGNVTTERVPRSCDTCFPACWSCPSLSDHVSFLEVPWFPLTSQYHVGW